MKTKLTSISFYLAAWSHASHATRLMRNSKLQAREDWHGQQRVCCRIRCPLLVLPQRHGGRVCTGPDSVAWRTFLTAWRMRFALHTVPPGALRCAGGIGPRGLPRGPQLHRGAPKRPATSSRRNRTCFDLISSQRTFTAPNVCRKLPRPGAPPPCVAPQILPVYVLQLRHGVPCTAGQEQHCAGMRPRASCCSEHVGPEAQLQLR